MRLQCPKTSCARYYLHRYYRQFHSSTEMKRIYRKLCNGNTEILLPSILSFSVFFQSSINKRQLANYQIQFQYIEY